MLVKSFEDLEIYQESFRLAMKIHNLTLQLPKYETFEEGNQIRRSTKSIPANIVEGFCRKRYKNEFIRFLTYAHGSCCESIVHLNFIFNSGYITQKKYKKYFEQYNDLSRKIFKFIRSIENPNEK